MKNVILSEKEVKNKKGEVLGIERIELTEENLQKALGDKVNASLAEKEQKLKNGGYTDGNIAKIKAELNLK